MKNLTIEQQLSKEDYAKFVDFSIFDRKSFNKIFLLIVAPILGVGLLTLFFVMGEETNVLFIVLCVFLIILGWTMRYIFRWMSNSNFKKNPLLSIKNFITFNEEQIDMTSKRGKSFNRYTEVDRVYIIKDYIIVYFVTQQFLGINTQEMQASTKDQIIQILKDKCLGKVIFK